MLDIKLEDLDTLSDEEFLELENHVARLTSAWKIQNMRGICAIFHDDQHIGEKRHEYSVMHYPGINYEEMVARRMKPVVDNLEGNTLIHPLTTPVIEVNKENNVARSVWWSIGIEGLSKFRETPMAIISLGMVPTCEIIEDGEWRTLWGGWQRTTKNEYHAGWVHSMIPTNMRPPLTREQDLNFLGKYAYLKDRARMPVPEPPHKDTFEKFPDEMDKEWQFVNLEN